MFAAGELFALQTATHLPGAPPWATAVGQGYWLALSEGTTADLSAASISIQYLGSQVPEGEERWLRVYYWDEDASSCAPRSAPCWRQLPTELDTEHNAASAQVQGAGLYALMSSIEVPLYGAGWNLTSYPIPGTRPVTEALRSIDGYYDIVYGYDALDTVDPWQVYGVGVPNYVNDLHELVFSHGYWISATEAMTLYLKGASGTVLPQAQDASLSAAGSAFGSPPATYYGTVQADGGFAPTAGMLVYAYVDGRRCGQGETLEVSGEIVYSINVYADVLHDGGAAGCGDPGNTVTFHVGGQLMQPTVTWNDSRLGELALTPQVERRIYLPVVLKNR